MWYWKDETREKLVALLGKDAPIDEIMAIFEADVERLEESYGYEIQEAVERATGDF